VIFSVSPAIPSPHHPINIYIDGILLESQAMSRSGTRSLQRGYVPTMPCG
jgi:hypothetical protein